MADSPASVLVVDDEPGVAEAYALWLEGEYDVQTAHNGEEALEVVSDATDVVLLDRRMPGLSGDEVLEELRERGHDCPIAMVTAIDPEVDIVDMPFDAYLTKPVRRDEIIDMIEELLEISEYDEELRELFAIAQKRAALAEKKPLSELENHQKFSALQEMGAELATETEMELDHESFEKTLAGIDVDESPTVF